MKHIQGPVSTTHIDRHGDRMSVEALHDMARQIAERYIPMNEEHDIRYPPIGRTVSAQVVTLEDGEFALDAVSELWEPGDTAESLRGDGRRIPLRIDDQPTFAVVYDQSFLGEEEQAFVRDLAQLAGGSVKTELQMKKALEPLATLILIAGAFALGSIASGFFNRLGSDLYDALKQQLKGFFHNRPRRESLLDFLLVIEREDQRFEVHVVVENATPQVIDELFDAHFGQLDHIVQAVCEEEPDVARVVLKWHEGRLTLLYAVRSDAFPSVIGQE